MLDNYYVGLSVGSVVNFNLFCNVYAATIEYQSIAKSKTRGMVLGSILNSKMTLVTVSQNLSNILIPMLHKVNKRLKQISCNADDNFIISAQE